MWFYIFSSKQGFFGKLDGALWINMLRQEV